MIFNKKKLIKQAKTETINEFADLLIKEAIMRFSAKSEHENILTIYDVRKIAKHMKEKL